MGRPKVAVGVLLGATVVAVAVILLANPPYEVERLMRSEGPTKRQYTRDGSGAGALMWVLESLHLPAQRAVSSHLLAELKKRGWREEPACIVEITADGAMSVLLVPPELSSTSWITYVEGTQAFEITYARPPTTKEQALHRVKAFLHISE